MVDMGFHFFEEEMLAAGEGKLEGNEGNSDVSSGNQNAVDQLEKDANVKQDEEF